MATKTRTAQAAAQAVNGSAHTPEQIHASRLAQINDEYMASSGVPSSQRQIVAGIGQLLMFSTSIYWGIQAVGVLMTAAIVFTGSSFLAFVVGVMGAFLAIKSAWDIGTGTARFILSYDTDTVADVGRDLRVAAARKVSLVKGWFKREDRIEVDASAAA